MFVPRHPVVENQYCQLAATTTSGGFGGVLAYAGSVVYLDVAKTTVEPYVNIYTANENYLAFGFLMQKVKTGYHLIHPPGFYMPGDLGSSDVIAQPSYDANGLVNGTKVAPVGVAHLGIWDTIHYAGGVLYSGAKMFVRQASLSEICDASLTENTQTTLAGSGVLAIVVRGATAAQVAANMANTTLYPIRIKLLV